MKQNSLRKIILTVRKKNIKGYWRSLIADNRPNDVENRPNNANMLIFDEINVTLNVSRNARIAYKIILC